MENNPAEARTYTYEPKGTCSRLMEITVNDEGVITNARIFGGCMGNTQGVCALAKGMKATEVKQRLKGILCGNKGTSCPDQLAKALEEMGEKHT